MDEERRALPSEDASILSKWTYSWIWPLMKRTRKGSLRPSELYKTPKWMATRFNARKFNNLWWKHGPIPSHSSEQTVGKGNVKDKTSLKGWIWITIFFGGPMLIYSGILTLESDLLGFASSHAMRHFLDGLKGRNLENSSIEPAQLYLRGGLLLLISLTKKLLLNQGLLIITTLAYLLRAGVMSACFDHLLRMKRVWMVGAALNRMAVDTNRLTVLVMFSHLIWSSPLRILLSFITVYRNMGLPALGGIGFVLLVISSLFWLARQMRKIRAGLAQLSDQRLQLTSEALSSIANIKASSEGHLWESEIDAIRQRELQGITRLNLLFACSASLNFWSPVFAVTISVVTAIILEYELEAGVVFSSARAFQMLMIPMWMLPTLVNRVTAASVASRRLTELFGSEVEADTGAGSSLDSSDSIKTAVAMATGEPPFIKIQDVTLCIDEKVILKEINLQLDRPCLVGIEGELASGKSLLLSFLAGIIQPQSGYYDHSNTIGYCPFPGWIRQGTLKDNLLLDRPYDSTLYEGVKAICHLTKEEFPDDEQVLGEDGCTISGGQKQRIALARAIYGRPSILLLDNSLSSLNPPVARNILTQLKAFLGPHSIIVISTSDKTTLCQFPVRLFLADQQVKVIRNAVHPSSLDEVEDLIVASSDPEADENTKLLAMSQEAKSGCRGTRPSLEDEDVLDHDTWKLTWTIVGLSGGILLYLLLFLTVFGTDFLKLERDKLLKTFMKDNRNSDGPLTLNGDWRSGTRGFLLQFSLLGGAQGLLTVIANIFAVYLCIRASRQVHRLTLNRILHAKMSALKDIPTGRLLNRLGRDLEHVDYTFPEKLISLFGSMSSIICIILGIIQLAPVMLLTLLVPLLMITILQNYFSRNWRTLLRLSGQTLAPISSLFGETIAGITTIRAHRAATSTLRRFQSLCDAYTMSSYLSVASRRWISLRCEFVASLYVGALILYCIMTETIDDATAGMLLLYGLGAAENMDYFIKHLAEIDHCLISVERTVQFSSDLPQESMATLSSQFAVSRLPEKAGIAGCSPLHQTSVGPTEGGAELNFDNVHFGYGDDVLKGVSFRIERGERVLISGKTGSGKSSIINAILRLSGEKRSGDITINGRFIEDYGLAELRGGLVVTALQDSRPLDSLPLRRHLDPHDRHDEHTLWSVLKVVCLREIILDRFPARLDQTSFNSLLSSGQRQLLTLAKCILSRPPLLILDESTTALDEGMDTTIHERILSWLPPPTTIIAITHRLESIRHLYSRHFVLQDGLIRCED